MVEIIATTIPTTIAPTIVTSHAVRYLFMFFETILIISPTSKQDPKVSFVAKLMKTAGK